MRRWFATAIAASIAFFGDAGPARADDETYPQGWYVFGGGGVNFLESITISPTPPIFPGSANHRLNFDEGWLAGGGIGRTLPHNFRIEIELMYRRNEVDAVTNLFFQPPPIVTTFVGEGGDVVITTPQPLQTFDGGGVVTSFSQFLNLLYDIPLGDGVSAFLGGGAGVSEVDADVRVLQNGTPILVGNERVFAYQGIAGLSLTLSPRTQAFADYRYFRADGVNAVSGSALADVEFDYESHAVFAGLRLFLTSAGGPVAQAPPAAPAVVYFDADKANINSLAQTFIENAVNQANGVGVMRFTIRSAGDTVQGAAKETLDAMRAIAIKRSLVALGVSENQITVSNGTALNATQEARGRAVIEIP
jgi:opacity protein-like surface antigen